MTFFGNLRVPDMKSKMYYFHVTCELLVFMIVPAFSLRELQIAVPRAIRSGEPVTMSCSYDLEGAALYSIRWYRAETEFYRYVPKEIPPTRVFPLPSAEVDLELSNQHDVRLIGLHRQLTGEYQCEVSADAPLFHTEIRSSFMLVVDVPEEEPVLSVDKLRYSVGETIKANCSCPASFPGANISWYINDKVVPNTVTTTLPEDPELWEAESSFSFIEITTEQPEEYRQYQVGGGVQQTSSSQLKPVLKQRDQVFIDSGYEYNQNRQVYVDTSQNNAKDDIKIPAESTIRGLNSRNKILQPKVSKIHLRPGFGGIFTLRCEANIFDVYNKRSIEQRVKEDTPQIASVMGQESSGTSFKNYTPGVLYLIAFIITKISKR